MLLLDVDTTDPFFVGLAFLSPTFVCMTPMDDNVQSVGYTRGAKKQECCWCPPPPTTCAAGSSIDFAPVNRNLKVKNKRIRISSTSIDSCVVPGTSSQMNISRSVV